MLMGGMREINTAAGIWTCMYVCMYVCSAEEDYLSNTMYNFAF